MPLSSSLLSINELSLPLIFLYAETHFRFFSLFPSLLYKHEPEIVFDVPARCEPDEDLPVVLILNDIDRYPVTPVEVAVTVSQQGTGTELFTFTDLKQYEVDHPFRKQQQVFLFPIGRSGLPCGQLFVNATVSVTSRKKTITVFNDNLVGSSHRSFRCYRSDNSLPGKKLCTYGDLHVHSQYSRSHVEFGPPLSVIDAVAKCSGLSFVGITDHSYDLSCKMDNYLVEDQSLELWHTQRNELTDRTFSTVFIQGEEVSCNNNDGNTIHLGALGISDFIPGSVDGARRNLVFTSQRTADQVISEIERQGGVSFSAHPGSRSGLLQRIFLHRGEWTPKEFSVPPVGFQALNSGFHTSWRRGKALWIKLLQNGHRLPLLGGNDAHGDFSRYRAIKTPFLSIHEDFQRFMGFGKTGIYGTVSSQREVLDGIRNGSTFITTGPYIAINYTTADAPAAALSSRGFDTIPESMAIHALSTTEFGAIQTVALLSGTRNGPGDEHCILRISPEKISYHETIPIPTEKLSPGTYVRAEIETRCDDGTTFSAFTSACYL